MTVFSTPDPPDNALCLHNVCWSPILHSIRSTKFRSHRDNPPTDGASLAKNFALHDISCCIAPGDRVAIVGPNGAGKTSLLRCILGLRSLSSGTIELANKPLSEWSLRQRATLMSYVPQQTHSEFALRVADVVQMGRIPSASLWSAPLSDRDKPAWWQWQQRFNQTKQIIAQALQAVGMAHTESRLLSSLSGGEQQRVLIARALIQQAKILVMDEPINHLDVFYQHQILTLLKSLHLTVILTLHDLNLAAQYCDKVLLMNNGQLVADGTPADVFTSERLSDVFRLPCEVQHVGEAPSIPSICFHPQRETTVASHSLQQVER